MLKKLAIISSVVTVAAGVMLGIVWWRTGTAETIFVSIISGIGIAVFSAVAVITLIVCMLGGVNLILDCVELYKERRRMSGK